MNTVFIYKIFKKGGGPAFYFEPIRDQEMISGRDSSPSKPSRVI